MAQASKKHVGDAKHYEFTRLCTFHLQGVCSRGSACSFAHHEADVRDKPNFYKTRLCEAFRRSRCPRGKDCQFAHGGEEMKRIAAARKKERRAKAKARWPDAPAGSSTSSQVPLMSRAEDDGASSAAHSQSHSEEARQAQMAGPCRQSALSTNGHTASASSSHFGSSSGDPLGGITPPVQLDACRATPCLLQPWTAAVQATSLSAGRQKGYTAAPTAPCWPSVDPYICGDLGAFIAAESQGAEHPGVQASFVARSNRPRGTVDVDHESEGQTFDNTKFWL